MCGQCLRRPPSFDAAAAAVDYAFPWDGLLARFKFHAQPELGIVLAQRMIAAIAGLSLPRATLVLPVPLGRDRLRERGYNQAWELARRIGHQLDLPARVDGLARGHTTTHQVGLSRAEREANLRHSLWVEPAAATAIAHQHVALVDDVMTTGATADAAASALRRAGAAHVQVWVLARTPEPPGREAAQRPRQ